MIIFDVIGEIRRSQSEEIPDLAAGKFVIADLDGLDPAAGGPGGDLHLLHVRLFDGFSVHPVDGPDEVVHGDGLDFLPVSGIVFIRALHAPQIRHHIREDFLGVFRSSAGGGMEHQVTGQFSVIVDHLALRFHGRFQELAPVFFHPLVTLLFPKLFFGGEGLTMDGVAQIPYPGQPVGPGRHGLCLQGFHVELSVHFAAHHAGYVFFQRQSQILSGGCPPNGDVDTAFADFFFHFFDLRFRNTDPIVFRIVRQNDVRDPVQQDHRDRQYIG